MRGYWLPVILGLLQCLIISAITIGLTYAGYLVGAHYHNAYNCDLLWNWLNPQCQVSDFIRTTAKQWVYRQGGPSHATRA